MGEHQHVSCPNPRCPNILRLRISEADYGKTVEVTCPTCGAKRLATIVDQKRLRDLLQKLSSATEEAISESDKIHEVVQEINEAGFLINGFVLATELAIIQKQKPPKPEVLGVKTKFNFTSDDESFARGIHIKLDED